MGVVEIVQLGLNGGALIGGAVVWKFYVANLKQDTATKQSELDLVTSDRDIWKDKARDLEKRSPELMEQMLNGRIEIREQEIARLGSDREKNEAALRKAESEKADLQADLERTKGFRRVLDLEDPDEDHETFLDERLGVDRSTEVVALGEVGVDSGMLMVTDPYYIDSEWVSAPWARGRRLKDPAAHSVYVEGQDFEGMDAVFEPYGKTPRELIASGVLEVLQEDRPVSYSFEGVVATSQGEGYGELKYRLGGSGAGVVFPTAFGDGGYMVYGEVRNGKIVRVYLNVT